MKLDMKTIMLFAHWIKTSNSTELVTKDSSILALEWYLVPSEWADDVRVVVLLGKASLGFYITEVLTNGGALLSNPEDIIDFLLK